MSWNDLRTGRFSQAQGEYFITFNTHNKIDFLMILSPLVYSAGKS